MMLRLPSDLNEYVAMFDDEYWRNVSLTSAGGLVQPPEPQNMLEESWVAVTSRLSDFQLFVAFYALVLVAYLGSSAILYEFSKLGWFEKYKIQAEKDWPESWVYGECLRNIVFNFTLVGFPLGAFAFPVMKMWGLSSALPLPPLSQFLGHMFVFLVVEDALHYALHRILHIPVLYKLIHKEHHRFKQPFGLAAAYSTASEMLILSVPTFLPAVLIAPHFFTFYVWFVVRQLDAVLRHSGYDFPDPLNVLPFYGGTRFHDAHHEGFNFNFSSRFTYLDKLGGTYRELDHESKKSKSKSE